MEEYQKSVDEENLYKPKLFTYPEHDTPVGVFDFEDLENDEALLVLCARAKPNDSRRNEDIAYVWHGSAHEVSPEDVNSFAQQCIGVYFGSGNAAGVRVQHEHFEDESDEFQDFFEQQD